MLRRVSVNDVQSGLVTRDQTYLAVVMRYYPRFLKKDLRDEYIPDLAPPADLFAEFKALDRELKNHDLAFARVNYEAKFNLNVWGRKRLRDLAEVSHERDVALVCQCASGERCHCDLLLLWAVRHFGAEVAVRPAGYAVFEGRLGALCGL